MFHAFKFTNEAARINSGANLFSSKVVVIWVGSMSTWLASHLSITSRLAIFKSRHGIYNRYVVRVRGMISFWHFVYTPAWYLGSLGHALRWDEWMSFCLVLATNRCAVDNFHPLVIYMPTYSVHARSHVIVCNVHKREVSQHFVTMLQTTGNTTSQISSLVQYFRHHTNTTLTWDINRQLWSSRHAAHGRIHNYGSSCSNTEVIVVRQQPWPNSGACSLAKNTDKCTTW